ncbi:MAG TPA: 4-hydroxy-tetrahydrodipicolinate synthase [Gemmatimonadales bacterium]|nr:4-hydroxy-tetrahydrodipicolinate synthase [Gemmatimonadales bacterium]
MTTSSSGLRGCGTALVTPFTAGGAVDFLALKALVQWQIAEGIDFLVPCGSTGEAQTLDARERERVVVATLEAAAGRVPVMAGATSNDTARAADEARRMAALGADYILSATPYYNKPTQEGLYRHFLAVAEASRAPVCLYNVPGRTAVNLAAETTLRLAGHDNIVAIKEASGDLAQMMKIIRGRPTGFRLLSGDDNLALAVVAVGGDGLVSVTSNEAPRAMTELIRLALDGDVAGARTLHYRLLPLMDANFLETNPAPVKAALHLMGHVEDVLRLPLVAVSDATRERLRAALEVAGIAAGAGA